MPEFFDENPSRPHIRGAWPFSRSPAWAPGPGTPGGRGSPTPAAPEIRRLVADMVETMIDANGGGARGTPRCMSRSGSSCSRRRATRAQDGISEAEMFDHTAPLTVLVNPVIEIVDPATESGWEGCLSVPGLRGLVERPAHIRYRGYDTQGKLVSRTAKGFHARVVQHECDHLDGILYPQRDGRPFEAHLRDRGAALDALRDGGIALGQTFGRGLEGRGAGGGRSGTRRPTASATRSSRARPKEAGGGRGDAAASLPRWTRKPGRVLFRSVRRGDGTASGDAEPARR